MTLLVPFWLPKFVPEGTAMYDELRKQGTRMVDLRLYALVDPERANGLALDDLASRVAQGGATLVQLRDKHGDTRRLVDEARAIKAALQGSGVPLLINDRVDVALAAGAHGVHV